MILVWLLMTASSDTMSAAPHATAQIKVLESVRLAAGTPVRLVTPAAIESRAIRQGQRLALTLADDVTVGARVVIPRGTPAVGEVDSLTEKSTGGVAGRFMVKPLFIEWRGERIHLRGGREAQGDSQVAASALTSVLLSGLGVLISGTSANLPAGSIIEAEIRSHVSVVPPAPSN